MPGRAGGGETGRTVSRVLLLAFATHWVAGPVGAARHSNREFAWHQGVGDRPNPTGSLAEFLRSARVAQSGSTPGDELRPRASSTVLRTAGLVRWAFGPPPKRAARTRRNWAENWAVLLRFRRNRRACGGASSMPGPAAAARTGGIEAACWLVGWAEFLQFAEPRRPQPPAAAACNSRSSFLGPAGSGPLWGRGCLIFFVEAGGCLGYF